MNNAAATPYRWPEPIETIYQILGGGAEFVSKVPYLTLPIALFIAAVVNTPRQERPWGIITWTAETFHLSRPTVYALGERVAQQVASLPQPEGVSPENSLVVTPERLSRTILTHCFPGNTSIRDMQACLQAAFDQTPGIGTISQLITTSGQQAGRVLAALDYSPLGAVITLRDETFFQDWPILIVIEPVSTTILWAEVCPDRQADTWGLVLLRVEEKGVTLKGLVEDMAQAYPKSQKLIDREELEVQKDIWHVERDGGRLARSLERAAYQAIGRVYDLETNLLAQWDEAVFSQQYLPAVATQERAIAQYDTFVEWYAHLQDALELVDRRSGEIRDRQTNGWLLEETLSALEKLDHTGVKAWVKRIRTYQKEMLTFLDWAQAALAQYQREAAGQLPDGFIATVARCWWYRHALINGHLHFKDQAQLAELELELLLDPDPTLTQWADKLLHILEAAVRASSLVEAINNLLKSFLNSRRSFHNIETLQAYLNLFVLWHNMRVYPRGKRSGKSPYQLAGIKTPSDDWLELLGYPAR